MNDVYSNEVIKEIENRDFHRFVERLKTLAKSRRVNFADIMKACKMPSNTLYRIENGTRKPDVKTLAKLAVYFGADINWLLGLKDHEDDEQEMVELFNRALPEDKQAIQAILSKYQTPEEND